MTEQPVDAPNNMEPVPAPNTVDDRMAVTESFLGLAEDVRFEEAVAQKLATEIQRSGDIDSRQPFLETNGIAVDAALAPSSYDLGRLVAQDWEAVRTSEHPLLTLYAAANYHHEEAETTFIPAGRQFPRHDDPRVGYEGMENRAEIASLPLIHGLSAAAFMQLAENGTMQSNKTRYKQSETDALTFHGAGVGATNLQDRELGLDQYVFFDYGRPAFNHREQPEITLVVDPAVMDQPGVFMTSQDIADTTSAEQYMRGLTTPQYFRETALLRICNSVVERGEERSGGHYTGYNIYNRLNRWVRGQDGDFDQDNNPQFSTYEVKVPDEAGVPTSAIRRVIVRDQATFEQLQATMGDRFEFIHEPRLRAAGGRIPGYEGDPRDSAAIDQGNYPELLQIPGAFEARMEEQIEADYQARSGILDALPETEKEQTVVVFATSEPDNIDGADIRKRINIKTNPYLYNGTIATYSSMEALSNDVANTNDPGDFTTAAGQDHWFHEPFIYDGQKSIRTVSGKCVLATIERSRQDPRLSRIVDARAFSLEELGNA